MRRAITRQRHNDGPPPKPDFVNQSELKINTDDGFDEADRKKFEMLAEPFLDEVGNLPQVLEDTINSNHFKNAESLVLNKEDLQEVTELLGSIQGKLQRAFEEAQSTRKEEQIVSDKLRSIDLNSDKDTQAIDNRQKLYQLLNEVFQIASVPENEKRMLETLYFPNTQNIEVTFQAVLRLTREVEKNEAPPLLLGLKAADERIIKFKELLNNYASNFVTFIEYKMKVPPALRTIVQTDNDPPVEFIPPSFDELFLSRKPDPEEKEAEPPKSETKEVDPNETKSDKQQSDDEKNDSDNEDNDKSESDNESNSSDSDGEMTDAQKNKKRRHHHHSKKSSSSKKHKSKSGKRHKSSRHSRSSKDLTDKKIELSPPPIVENKDQRKRFSIPEAGEHYMLRYINRFWKHIRWAQKYHYDDCYLKIRDIYVKSTSRYLRDEVCNPIASNISAKIVSKRSVPRPTDPFSIDNEYMTPQSNSFVAKITENLNTVFKSLKIESCILTEFWGITDPQMLSKAVPIELKQTLKVIGEMINQYDPIYYIVVMSICTQEEKNIIIPIDDLIEMPRAEWRKVIKDQVSQMKNIKLSKSKDTVIKVFQDVPNYIKALIYISPKQGTEFLERTIAKILEEIAIYITNYAIPKGMKKNKAARMIIVNLVYLTEALGKEPFLIQSMPIKEQMKKINDLLNENVKIFLESMAEKAWEEPYRFFHQIDEWMKQEAFTYEIVTFQVSHTPEKFKELNEKIDKRINISIGECHAFLKKKIKAENLRNELKKTVVENVSNIFKRWSDLAEKCYGVKLITTCEKVTQLMQNYQKS